MNTLQVIDESGGDVAGVGCALLTVNDVAGYLRVHPRTIHLWARQHRIPAVRLGRSALRFRPSDVEAFLADCSIERGRTA